MVAGCENMVKAFDLCATHYMRFRRHGHINDTRKQRSMEICSAEGCGETIAAKGLCKLHYYRVKRIGSVNLPEHVEKICSVEGCGKPSDAKGLCVMHYTRVKDHGSVLSTRPSDWGTRYDNPLYSTWHSLLRLRRDEVCDRWRDDLWAFVGDLGDSRPSKKHTLARMDDAKPLGPDNFFWKEPRVSGDSPDVKKQKSAYYKAWRIANLRTAINADMQKLYGIGIDEYELMFEAQGAGCAICGGSEMSVDPKTKKVRRMAIDHCHKTGKVRGLLCSKCNYGLGRFNDSIELLEKAIGYLKKHMEPQHV